ncbi:MAG: polysaccharide deacetylase family protein [Paracoccaceae bacterium]
MAGLVSAIAGVAPAPLLLILAAALVSWTLLSDRWMRTRGGIPVLVWHSVSRDAGWLPWAANISVTPETLDRQLSILRRMGCACMDSVAFVQARLRGQAVPENTVILHFDDGYLDNWVAAAPILRRHGMRATVFVSLDFVAPDRPPPATIEDRDAALKWDGYLSWEEILALDSGAFGGVFRVEAHGVDHGRVPTGPEVVDRITPQNWRRLAWMQWARMPGDKHDWYRNTDPPVFGYGTAVPRNGAALSQPAWTGTGCETEDAYAARVRRDLRACRASFLHHLGRAPQIFCWPQNQTSPLARQIADQQGYLATTGGRGNNRTGEDPRILSRVHVGERVAGFAWPAADDLFFRASIHSFRGNHWWYLPMAALSALARVTRRLHAHGGQA